MHYRGNLMNEMNAEYLCEAIWCFFFSLLFWCFFFCYFQGAFYVVLKNRMLFLIVHYWEVMVDMWPVIVQVRISTFKYFSNNINPGRLATGQEMVREKLKLFKLTELLGNLILSQEKLTFWGTVRENWNYNNIDAIPLKAQWKKYLGHCDFNVFFLAQKANLLKKYRSML